MADPVLHVITCPVADVAKVKALALQRDARGGRWPDPVLDVSGKLARWGVWESSFSPTTITELAALKVGTPTVKTHATESAATAGTGWVGQQARI